MILSPIFHRIFFIALLWIPSSILLAESFTPKCRLDSTLTRPVEYAANLAINNYRTNKQSLPFEKAKVNAQPVSNTLVIEIVIDATQNNVNSDGCIKNHVKAISENNSLDQITVRGGCYVSEDSDQLIRCSRNAILAFLGKDKEDINNDPASPALLYVLAHEIGHIYQHRHGEFIGRIENLNLKQPIKAKLEKLKEICDTESEKKEKEADELALIILQRELPTNSSYKVPILSTRGSLYWNIDKINLAADAWTKLAIEQFALPTHKVHSAFVPTVFPTPKETIQLSANGFVCDVLTQKKGIISFPWRETDHPAPEQRLRRIAEELKPIADNLPKDDGSNDFAPIAKLQNDMSPIFTFIYIETGIYMETVYKEICTLIRSDLPMENCKK